MKTFRLLVTKKITGSLVLRAGLKGIDILEKEFIRIQPVVSDTSKENNRYPSRLRNILSPLPVRMRLVRCHCKRRCEKCRLEDLLPRRRHKRRDKKSTGVMNDIAGTAQNASGLVTEIKNTTAGEEDSFLLRKSAER